MLCCFRAGRLALLSLGAVASIAIAADPTPQQIVDTIKEGKDAIYAMQKPNGTWDLDKPEEIKGETDNYPDAGQWGGSTAIAVYALIVCGEGPNDPKLQKAIDFLHKQTVTGTYAVSFKCLVWLHLPATEQVRRSMARDARLLRGMVKTQKTGMPVWDYGAGPRKEYSLSRTQYGTLGLWAASEMDIEIPTDFWRALERTWETSQTADGAWGYRFPTDEIGPLTASMTAAALASLFIVQDFTKGPSYATAKGNASSEPINRGLRWLTANFKERVATAKALDREFTYAQLYAIERVGLSSGLRRFGEYDWYAHGAQYLVAKQGKAGWPAGKSTRFTSLSSTCWAILFLQRGRTPVAFNKLDYSSGVSDPKKALWNQRPRDAANVTRWIGKNLERELRWQVVASNADIGDLLEAPVLYLAGSGAQQFTPEAKALLKAYIDHGGIILAHADSGDAAFAQAITRLGTELVSPNEWRTLPETHPIYTNQNYKREAMRSKPMIKSISNGVRECVILLPPSDAAKAWQLREPKQMPEQWELAANILSYAADKTHFYPRGESWILPTPAAKVARTWTVGRLKYAGSWDPEPQAFRQLDRYMQANGGSAVQTQPVEAGQPLDKIDLLHITGTTTFQLPPAAIDSIRGYLEKGGTVLFEAAGGNAEFATSAEREIGKLMRGEHLKRLPLAHPFYANGFIAEFRTFGILSIANPTEPQLMAIERQGRPVVIFSREDMSAGLLGVPSDGIIGYKPAAARKLMSNVIGSLKR